MTPRGAVAGRLALGLLALWAVLARAADAAAQGDPRLRWETLDTPHFHIHYYQDEAPIARRVARVAEGALGRLAGPLGWTPSQPTEIVLTDGTDAANGSATAVPVNTIRLNVTAPDDLSTLNEYDDWLTTLVTHEFTHILHTDHVGGIPAIVNAIVGKQWAPNQIQPRWVLEGLAVYEESLQTTGGRLRSSQWDMYLRADALADNLATLDQLSTGPERWPHGELWYLYGSYFMQYVADRFGPQALADLSAEYGSMAMPWQLGRAIRRVTGYDWEELYADFCAALRSRYAAQRRAIEAAGVTPAERLTTQGEEVHSPRFLADGTLVYESSDGRSHPALRALDPGSAVPRSLDWVGGAAGFGVADAPGTPSLVVSDLGVHRDTYFYHDLYRWNLARGADGRVRVTSTERLTDGFRAQQPDVSPDGDHVVFTVNHRGTTSLFEMSLAERVPRPLFRPRRFEQVYAPRYSPDGRSIAFSYWREGGYRDVVVWDRAAARLREVTHDRAMDLSPTWSPDGRWLVWSSDRSGVMNLYAYEVATARVRRATNVVLGAFQPAVSPDGRTMAYVGYSHLGFDLYRAPFDPAAWPRDDTRDDAHGDPTSNPLPHPATPASHPPDVPMHAHPYNPWLTLYPRTWTAELVSDGFGQQLAIRTQGSDVVGRHSWTARVGAGLVRGDPLVDFSYVYRGLRPALRVHAYRSVDAAGGYRVGRVSPRWVAERLGGETGIDVAFPGVFDSHGLSFQYEAQYLRAFGGLPGFERNVDPNEAPPVLPFRGWVAGLRATWTYSRVQRYAYSVSNQEGFTTLVSVHVTDALLGSDVGGVDVSAGVSGYIPMPWATARRRHVLALHAGVGIGVTDRGERGIFALGGFAPFSTQEFLDALRLGLQQGGIALRGYPLFARVGSQFELVNVEYRFPIVQIDRGPLTVPLFLHRISGGVFSDIGSASFGVFDFKNVAAGAGAELLVDFDAGFLMPFTLRLGYAHGFMADGLDQTYVAFSAPF